MKYTIIPAETEHAEGVVRLRRMSGVIENILSMPSERAVKFEKLWEDVHANNHNFVAVTDENVVIGCAGLFVESNPRKRHCGSISLIVDPTYHKQGIGSKLLTTILDIADNWLLLKRVELHVITDNTNAIKLYEKHGFQIEGTLRSAVISNGTYKDEHIMARIH